MYKTSMFQFNQKIILKKRLNRSEIVIPISCCCLPTKNCFLDFKLPFMYRKRIIVFHKFSLTPFAFSMDQHAPFFSRNWLDQPREQYQEQLRRLHVFMDARDPQDQFELTQVITLNHSLFMTEALSFIILVHPGSL